MPSLATYFRRRRACGSGFDADALAYFAAGSISNAVEKTAANNYIKGAKAAGIWQKCNRVYLVSPTSSTAALLCAKTLTSMTEEATCGSPAFTSNGYVLGSGDGYLSTHFNCFNGAGTLFTSTSGHITVYTPAAYIGVPIGCQTAIAADYIQASCGTSAAVCTDPLGNNILICNYNGYQTISRTASNSLIFYNDGVELGSETSSNSHAPANDIMFIGAKNSGGSYTESCDFTFRYATLGGGFTAAEALAEYNLGNAYNTALGRP